MCLDVLCLYDDTFLRVIYLPFLYALRDRPSSLAYFLASRRVNDFGTYFLGNNDCGITVFASL